MNEILIIFAIPFLISLLLSLYVSPRMKIISYSGRWDLNNGEERVNRMEVGGVPLFPVFLISLCFTVILPHVLQMETLCKRVDLTFLRLLQIIVGCAFLYILGLKDDFHGTGSGRKMLILMLTAAMFPASGLWINNLHGLLGIHALPYWLGMPFTFLLALFLTQLPSISDSPDGLAMGVCTLVVAAFLGLCLYGNFPTGSIISAATLGRPQPADQLPQEGWSPLGGAVSYA